MGYRYDSDRSGRLSYAEFVRGIYAQEKAAPIRSDADERQRSVHLACSAARGVQRVACNAWRATHTWHTTHT